MSTATPTTSTTAVGEAGIGGEDPTTTNSSNSNSNSKNKAGLTINVSDDNQTIATEGGVGGNDNNSDIIDDNNDNNNKMNEDDQMPLFSPRTMYSMKLRAQEISALHILMHLDMSMIRKQFQVNNGELNLYGFVGLLQKILLIENSKSTAHTTTASSSTSGGSNGLVGDGTKGTSSSGGGMGINNANNAGASIFAIDDQDQLVSDLVELFREIDLDGDNLIIWEEFTRYIIEKASLFRGQKVTLKIADYTHNKNIDPSSRHQHKDYVERLCPLPRKEQVAAVEMHSNVVTFYDAKNGKVRGKVVNKAVPLAVCYIDKYPCVVTSCADMTMASWNLDEGPPTQRYCMRRKWPTPSAQMSLCWVPSQQLVFSGSVTGYIHGWDIEERVEKFCVLSHTDIVMELISMSDLNMVVSASLDSTVCVWDTYTSKCSQKLLGHKKGVFSLAYNESCRLIFSAGFDHEILVWSPFVNTLLSRLQGHSASLAGICAVEGKPELISADITGVLKLWDLNSFKCVQTFTSDHEPGDIYDLTGVTSITHMSLFPTERNQSEKDSRCIAATKRLQFFDQERTTKDPVTADMPIRKCIFNDVSLTIITIAEKIVKVWDAITGNLKNMFRNISSAEISAACLDHRKRKFFVGNIHGQINAFNYQNGTLMKGFTNISDSLVVDLIYSESTFTVIAAFAEGKIAVFNELNNEFCECLRQFDTKNQKIKDISCLSYSPKKTMVVSCGNDPKEGIKVWGFETGKGEITVHLPVSPETGMPVQVYCLKVLEPLPFIMAATADGAIHIFSSWALVDTQLIHLFSFNNVQPSEEQGFTFDGEEKELYPMYHKIPPEKTENEEKKDIEKNQEEKKMLNEDEVEEEEEKEWLVRPRFDSPRATNPCGVLCLVWDNEEQCVYTGDDAGRLRKYSLVNVFKEFAARRVMSKRRDGTWQYHNYVKTKIRKDKFVFKESLVEFCWSIEAHEDSITTMELTSDPPGILTASSDRCCKMWTKNGRHMGVLLQGLYPGVQNTEWSLDIDINTRISKDQSETNKILELVKKNSFTMEKKKSSNRSKSSMRSMNASKVSVMSEHSEPGDGEQVGSFRKSQTLREDSITDKESEKLDRHNTIINLLEGVKTMHTAVPEDDPTNDPNKINLKKRVPIGMKLKVVDSYSGIDQEEIAQFNSLQTSAAPEREKKNAEKKNGILNSLTERKKQISRNYRNPPSPTSIVSKTVSIISIVPPSPGRKDEISDEVKESLLKLKTQLDEWEKDLGENRFKGKRVTLSDFAKFAPSGGGSLTEGDSIDNLSSVTSAQMLTGGSIKPVESKISEDP